MRTPLVSVRPHVWFGSQKPAASHVLVPSPRHLHCFRFRLARILSLARSLFLSLSHCFASLASERNRSTLLWIQRQRQLETRWQRVPAHLDPRCRRSSSRFSTQFSLRSRADPARKSGTPSLSKLTRAYQQRQGMTDHLEDILGGVEDEIRRAEERLQQDVFRTGAASGRLPLNCRMCEREGERGTGGDREQSLVRDWHKIASVQRTRQLS